MLMRGDNDCKEYYGTAGCRLVETCSSALSHDSIVFDLSNSPQLKTGHPSLPKNKACRHLLSDWLIIWICTVCLCVSTWKQNYNVTADQKEPSEEHPFRESWECSTQPGLWLGESNRERMSRGLTEERNKGKRAATQITRSRKPCNFWNL